MEIESTQTSEKRRKGGRKRPPFLNFRQPSSGVNASLLDGERNAVDGQHVGRYAIVHSVRLGIADNIVEALCQNALKLLVDHRLLPEVALPVLHPLEVGGSHAACVREDVGDD